jgi:hypothetical protein
MAKVNAAWQEETRENIRESVQCIKHEQLLEAVQNLLNVVADNRNLHASFFLGVDNQDGTTVGFNFGWASLGQDMLHTFVKKSEEFDPQAGEYGRWAGLFKFTPDEDAEVLS